MFVLASAAISRSGEPLKTTLAGHALVLEQVYLNGGGPYRMLVDTGNASSMIRPKIARQLHVQAVYTTDQATVAGTHRVPVVILDEIRIGEITDRSVEAIVGDVFCDGVDGVLGQSWLSRHDYLLDYRGRRISLDGMANDSGLRLPLRTVDGRPTVTASVDGRTRELVVDSGASALVLFERPGSRPDRLETNGGTVQGERCTVRLALPGGTPRKVEAVRIDTRGLGPGLLPASGFATVFVSNREGFVQFGR